MSTCNNIPQNSTNSKLHCVPEELAFPKTLNKKAWIKYFGRKLTKQETNIIEGFRSEQHMNNLIDKLNELCKKNNMYIPILTEISGDCMFESLVYHNIGNNIISLRHGLAWMMYIFKDYKYFIPKDDSTLNDKFIISNCGNEGTEYVVCKNKNMKKNDRKFYKYTYDTMCQDITNCGSWSKLEPHILLSVISILYKVEFIILAVSENGSAVHTINAFQNSETQPKLKKVYLGNIDNFHYFPIDILKDEINSSVKYYSENREKFIKWANTVEKIKIIQYNKHLKKIQDNDKLDENEDKKIKIDTSNLESIDINITNHKKN